MTDTFQSALLTLPDDAFFELIRNYLGPVKTPFNKHTLIARLVSFLRKPEILSAVWLNEVMRNFRSMEKTPSGRVSKSVL